MLKVITLTFVWVIDSFKNLIEIMESPRNYIYIHMQTFAWTFLDEGNL
jgi:hypothetical protein